MKAVIQSVKCAEVTINNSEKRSIGEGLVILLGVTVNDDALVCDKLCEKCANLRIFEDTEGKLNLSAAELSHDIMVVSNFTLCADTKKGRRPSFEKAAKPPLSINLYERFINKLSDNGIKRVVSGEFGAEMQVSLINDGPVTVIIDTEEWEKKQ